MQLLLGHHPDLGGDLHDLKAAQRILTLLPTASTIIFIFIWFAAYCWEVEFSWQDSQPLPSRRRASPQSCPDFLQNDPSLTLPQSTQPLSVNQPTRPPWRTLCACLRNSCRIHAATSTPVYVALICRTQCGSLRRCSQFTSLKVFAPRKAFLVCAQLCSSSQFTSLGFL